MTNINDKIREEQNDLAKKISRTLFEEAKPYIQNGNFAGLKGYVSYSVRDLSGQIVDGEALEAAVAAELDRETMVSVMGYTEWLASQIVRHNKYAVPLLEKVDSEAIMNRYDIRESGVLERVIQFMHSQPELPLLGKIEQGRFRPDYGVFESWKSQYDWGDGE